MHEDTLQCVFLQYTIFTVVAKTKKRRNCGFTVGEYKGSFLQNMKLPPWKILLANYWLSKHWDHEIVLEYLHISWTTSVDWSSFFCSETTEYCFFNLDSVGSLGVIVEMDETIVVKMKYERGRVLAQVWLFGSTGNP